MYIISTQKRGSGSVLSQYSVIGGRFSYRHALVPVGTGPILLFWNLFGTDEMLSYLLV